MDLYSTGLGAVWNTCNVQPGSTVAVFGLGAVGLAAVQASKARGVKALYCIDMNEAKFEVATKLGATHCINPTKLPEGFANIQSYIISLTT